jgi:RNA polymerase sigma-70 factor (ECF subfamily)
MRIVSNLALNFRRARKTRASSSLDDAMVIEEDVYRPGSGQRWEAPASDETGPLPDELHDRVSRAIAELPEKQRLALVLFSVEGLPQKDVAEILECKVGLVKWHVFEARRKLKETLQEYL